jgi:cyanophycinase
MPIARFFVVVLLTLHGLWFATPCAARGTVAVIGGALRGDNEEVWTRLVSAAGGGDAPWVVIPAASDSPQSSARQIEAALRRHGARGKVVTIPLAAHWPRQEVKTVARDAQWIAAVDEARGVYFTGGSQGRITAALLEEDGRDTPLLGAIRRVLDRGGVIAGSSAGAAVLSDTMIRDIPDLIAVLQRGVKRGEEVAQGLGFTGAGVLTDQHFLKRGRIGRLLPAMHATGATLGVGVEENTAALLRAETLEVLGPGGVLIADLAQAKVHSAAPFHMQGAVLHILDRGDRFDLGRRIAMVHEGKRARLIDPAAPDFKPYFTHVPFHADLLADRAIVNAMSTLLDSPVREARGLAFHVPAATGAAATAAARIGFEFRLFKRAGTTGYAPSAAHGEGYTILEMGLDILPVEMAAPLYTPLSRTKGTP